MARCRYCKADMEDVGGYCNDLIKEKSRGLSSSVWITGKPDEAYLATEVYYDGIGIGDNMQTYVKVKISFCPMCGRRL